MRVLIVLLGVIFSCCANHNPELRIEQTKAPVLSGGKLNCFQKNKNMGIIKPGQLIECTFLLKNIGREPVTILFYKASCNCTEVRLNKKIINPADTLRVGLIIDTKGKFPGLHSSTVILKTNGERTFYDLWANFEISSIKK